VRKQITNVQYVVDKKKCSGCGACYVACDCDAITIIRSEGYGLYIPFVDKGKCVNCKQCLDVCTGYTKVNKMDFDCPNNDPDIGEYRDVYYGNTLDEDLRKNAASGGCVTEVLRSGLRFGEIDAAVVVGLTFGSTIDSLVYVARTEEDILCAKASKYFPTNNCVALKELLSYPDEQFAFVGLPCQVNGLRLLQKKYPVLKKNIKLVVGLLCGHMVSFRGTRELLSAHSIRSSSLVNMCYRGGGWPGFFKAEAVSGHSVKLSSGEVWQDFFQNNIYTPQRCLVCADFFSNQADLSVGDAWDADLLKETTSGYSLMIVRSAFAENIIKKMYKDKILNINLYDIKKIKKNFWSNIVFSKRLVEQKKRMKIMLSVEIPPSDIDSNSDEQDKSSKVFFIVFLIFIIHKFRRLLIFITKLKLVRFLFNKVYSKILWRLSQWSQCE